MSKKESQKKGNKNEILKNVANALEKIKDIEKDHKAELEPLKIDYEEEKEIKSEKQNIKKKE